MCYEKKLHTDIQDAKSGLGEISNNNNISNAQTIKHIHYGAI